MGKITIYNLPAGKGDRYALLFQGSDKVRLLVIDSGYGGRFYPPLKNALLGLLKRYPGAEISMLLSHVHADHIRGFKSLFTDPDFEPYYKSISAFYYNTTDCILTEFKDLEEKDLAAVKEEEVVFTGRKTSYAEALTLEKHLTDKKIPVISGLFSGKRLSLGADIRALVLTPTRDAAESYRKWLLRKKSRKTSADLTDYNYPLELLKTNKFTEDFNEVNAFSVSILLEAYGRRLLFLGDAPPQYVSRALCKQGVSEDKKLEVDFVKLSHHASRRSASPELLSLIRGKRFLISGNGKPGHPDKECLARVIDTQNKPFFCLNHDIAGRIFFKEELESGEFSVEYGNKWEVDGDGIQCSTEDFDSD